ncbi:Ring finger domain [Popillia japonica]|uniref:Ring finger domain n=1 Tax=Popillia japonica TaxID=7064 RepID=A0AAW1IFF6_POPJA
MVCDRILLCSLGGRNCPQKRITGLYSLMFYNVITYCVSYIKELIEKEDWSPYVNMTQHSNIKHVAMSATKIVLEWTKAVTFIITVTFMLLVFGLEQGLEHYQPTALYTFITWSYYMCTERVFVELFPHVLVFLRINAFEALELLYAPVLLRYYTISISAFLILILLLYGQFRFAFMAAYMNVYLRAKEMICNCLQKLRDEQAILGRFRRASCEEIQNCDDVCAVCLSQMNRARVTPCQHFFHAECLRQCLNNSHYCPICKREYTFC